MTKIYTPEDISAADELSDIVKAIRAESRAEKRAQLEKDFINGAYDKSSTDRESILLLIEKHLLDSKENYPSLFRLHEDNCRTVEDMAIAVRDFMVQAANHGDVMTLSLGCSVADKIASEIIYGSKDTWAPDEQF